MSRMIDRVVGAPSGANFSDDEVEVDACRSDRRSGRRSGFSRESNLRFGTTLIAPEGAPTDSVQPLRCDRAHPCSRDCDLRFGVPLIAGKRAPTGHSNRFGHARNLRKGRWSGEHQTYLITTVTQNRERFFVEPAAARALIRALRRTEESGLAHTHAFVVMPDHLHWLLSLGEVVPLSTCVGQIKGESGRRINALLGRVHQAVWQHGFHDHALRQEEDMRAIARYVVANPLRAGLVEHVGDYPWWDAEWL